MFCRECGAKIADQADFCPFCGTRQDKTFLEEPLADDPVAGEEITQPEGGYPEEDTVPLSDETEKTGGNGDAADFSQTQPGGNGGAADFSQTQFGSSAPADSPKPQLGVNAAAVNRDPAQSGNNRKIGIAAVAVLAACILIGFICITVYHNSDGYKTKKAIEMVENGDYQGGSALIQSVYTPQAITVKKFADIQYAKENLLKSLSSCGSGEVVSRCESFRETLDEFEDDNELYYLSPVLQQQFNNYLRVMKFADDYVYSANDGVGWYSMLYDAQAVMMNMVDDNHSSKNGSNYMITDLQARVNTSEAALEKLDAFPLDRVIVKDDELKENLSNSLYSDSDGNYFVYFSAELTDILDDLSYYCNSEVTSNKTFISRLLEKWDADAKLYRVTPDMSYTSYVGSGLDRIDDWEDIHNNCSKMTALMRRDIVYGLLAGYSFS